MSYAESNLTRADVTAMRGPTVLNFGTNWCGHCGYARPAIDSAMAQHPEVRHLKIEDGKGRPLGRAFGVKLWPTLVFMMGGEEVARLVRPTDAGPIADALQKIDPRDEQR